MRKFNGPSPFAMAEIAIKLGQTKPQVLEMWADGVYHWSPLYMANVIECWSAAEDQVIADLYDLADGPFSIL